MFARTPRLTLRPGWPEDAPALTQAIAHEDVAFRLARLPWPYTLEHAAAWLARGSTPRDLALLIVAHDAAVPRLIGGIGLHPAEDGAAHEIGYWLTPVAWGRGYATEAGHAMIAIARHAMGLQRLAGRFFLDNPASGRVLGKLGFRDTGVTARLPCLASGEERPCALLDLDLMEQRTVKTALAA